MSLQTDTEMSQQTEIKNENGDMSYPDPPPRVYTWGRNVTQVVNTRKERTSPVQSPTETPTDVGTGNTVSDRNIHAGHTMSQQSYKDTPEGLTTGSMDSDHMTHGQTLSVESCTQTPSEFDTGSMDSDIRHTEDVSPVQTAETPVPLDTGRMWFDHNIRTEHTSEQSYKETSPTGLDTECMDLDHNIHIGHASPVQNYKETPTGLDTEGMNPDHIIHTEQGYTSPEHINAEAPPEEDGVHTEYPPEEDGVHHIIFVSGCDIELDISIKGLKLSETTDSSITYNATITMAKAFVLLGILGYKREELEEYILYPSVNHGTFEREKGINKASTVKIKVPVPTAKPIAEPPTVSDVVESDVKIEPCDSAEDFNLGDSTDDEEGATPAESVVPTEQMNLPVKKRNLGRPTGTDIYERDRIECDVCGKMILEKRLAEHKATHGDKTFSCTICPMKFVSKRGMVLHIKTHSSRRNMKREADLAEWAAIIAETGKKDDDAVATGETKVEAADLAGLAVSNTDTTTNTDNKDVASTSTENKSKPVKKRALGPPITTDLYQRDRTECNVCGKMVLTKRLVEHNICHGEKTFACPICPIKFAYKRLLVQHFKSHTGQRKKTNSAYFAALAQAATANKDDDSTATEQSVVEDTASFILGLCPQIKTKRCTPLARSDCDICGESVLTAKMTEHQWASHGEKRFQCYVCSTKFSSKSAWTAHTRRHARRNTRVNNTVRAHLHAVKQEEGLAANESVSGEQKAALADTNAATDNNDDKPAVTEQDVIADTASFILSLCSKKTKRDPQQRSDCEICQRSVLTARLLEHKRACHGEKRFECSLCSIKLSTKSALTAHTRRHARVKKDDVRAQRRMREAWMTANASASGEQNDPQGDADADTKADPEPPQDMSICDICGKDVPTTKMSVHRQIHGEKVHQCPTCPKKFAMKGGLTTHMIMHTDNKPHMCSVCGKRFYSRCQLKTHALLHTGEKPNVCSYCGFRSRCYSNLKRHVRAKHTNLKPYHCPYCPKVFADPTTIKQHKRIHEEEKPFKCELCPFASCRSNGLTAHMKSHARRSQIGQPMSDQQLKRISFPAYF